MTYLEAAGIGVLQGLTEFLPVSSSAHLSLAEHAIAGFHQPGRAFDVFLHQGTLLALLIYFRADIARLVESFFKLLTGKAQGDPEHAANNRMTLLVVVASVPTAVIGLGLNDYSKAATQSMPTIGGNLIVFGVLLALADRVVHATKSASQLSILDALLMGAAQGIAVVPGVSRSGITVTTGIFRGVSPEAAARFSFLLSIPAVLGAGLLELRKLDQVPSAELGNYFVGAAAAAVTGLAAIKMLIVFAKGRRLWWFAAYRLVLGAFVLGHHFWF